MKKDFICLGHLTAKSIIFILTTTFVLFSCNSPKENSANTTSVTTEIDLMALHAWEKSGDLVQKITLSTNGIVRNKNWGISIDSLNEKLELAENQPSNGKSYTLYFDDSDLNFTDITYLSDKKQQLNEIDFDIFVETKSQVDDLKEKFRSYLEVKFGDAKIEGKKIIWEKNKNTRVVLDDVSTAKDPGIKLVFLKRN